MLLQIGSPTREPGGSIAPAVQFFEDWVDFTVATKDATDATAHEAGESVSGTISHGLGTGKWLMTTDDGDEDPDLLFGHTPSHAGGGLRITADDGDLDWNLEVADSGTSGDGAFILAPNKRLIYETRIRTSATGWTFFTGLAPANTTVDGHASDSNIHSRVAAGDIANFAGFAFTVSAEIQTMCSATAAAGTESTGVSISTDTWVTLQFEWDGTNKIKFYADGALIQIREHRPTTSTLPISAAMTIQMGGRPVSGTPTVDVDYVACVFER